MYVEKDIFAIPENKNIKVWRYMDFTKLMSLLHTEELFFTRPDMFSDPFEGSLTKPASHKVSELFIEKSAMDHRQQFSEFLESFRKMLGVNCWHMNQSESAAMWQLYLKSDEGVAIQSSFNRLKDSFNVTKQEVSLSCVEYVDYDHHEFKFENGIINLFEPFIHKRNSFSHECELRAITMNTHNETRFYQKSFIHDISNDANLSNGLGVKVDLNILVENIYVSPSSPQWFYDLVCSSIEKFGFKFNVKRSKLIDKPIF